LCQQERSCQPRSCSGFVVGKEPAAATWPTRPSDTHAGDRKATAAASLVIGPASDPSVEARPTIRSVSQGLLIGIGREAEQGEEGALECWDAHSGSDFGPTPRGRFDLVDVGYGDMCAKEVGGNVRCFTSAPRTPLVAPPVNDPVQLAVGDGFVCARDVAGDVKCTTDGGWRLDPPHVPFRKIAAGRRHVCGLTQDGAVRCFGEDNFGETLPPLENGFADIGSGDRFSCAVAPGRPLRCWGDVRYD
jgi:hypothetical protein